MKFKYYNASDAPTEVKHLCNIDQQRSNTTYTTLSYKNKTYYIVCDTHCKTSIELEFKRQFEIKKTVRQILKNIPVIAVDFQEYDGEFGVLDNENYEVKTNNHTIRFALYINDCIDIENVRVFSDDEKLDIQETEVNKIIRKLRKQINY